MSVGAITAIVYAILLIVAFFLQATGSAFSILAQTRSNEQLLATPYLTVFRRLQRVFFREEEMEVLFFCISATKHLIRFGVAAAVTVIIWQTWAALAVSGGLLALVIVGAVFFAIGTLACVDFFPRYWGIRSPLTALHLSAPFTSLSLFAFSPLCFSMIAFTPIRFARTYIVQVTEPVGSVTDKILEMIEQAGVESVSDEEERRLLTSVAAMRQRIVREILVPRVEMFCLSETLSVREAAPLCDEEGYSRIPLYCESVDEITGLLLYKDLASLFLRASLSDDPSLLEQPIGNLAKSILYVPETNRVSRLLHDFRRQQTHLAIVVDEYGGTEGLVTIEDCLEEIVGEISDEYDEEEKLFTPHPGGGWIVDARMNIHDIEEQFAIKIPQEGEYDTIGGYAFHKAGEIPAAGLRIHHDEFELEILESSERCVEKILIRPTSPDAVQLEE